MDIPPEKLFFRIGEVAALTGLAPHVLRYWEGEFPRLRPRKGAGGQRVYRREDVEMILALRRMLHEEGYTIAGARRRLEEASLPPMTLAAGAAADTAPAPEAIRTARRGLQELLDLMENTDSLRSGHPDDSGRSAAR